MTSPEEKIILPTLSKLMLKNTRHHTAEYSFSWRVNRTGYGRMEYKIPLFNKIAGLEGGL
jgi:hypothetical protein